MGNDEHGPAYPEPPKAYRCPICRGDENRYMTCDYPGCPDGRDHGPQVRYDLPRHALWDDPAWNAKQAEVLSPGGDPPLWLRLVLCAAVIGTLFWLFTTPAPAMDHGFDPLAPTTQWMEALQRPNDRPGSCCGVADAYQADTYIRHPDGSYTVTVTDGSAVEFPDGTHRTPLKNGTVIEVPAAHVNPPTEQMGNPTGHAWVFLSVYGIHDEATGFTQTLPGTLYCFVPLPDGS